MHCRAFIGAVESIRRGVGRRAVEEGPDALRSRVALGLAVGPQRSPADPSQLLDPAIRRAAVTYDIAGGFGRRLREFGARCGLFASVTVHRSWEEAGSWEKRGGSAIRWPFRWRRHWLEALLTRSRDEQINVGTAIPDSLFLSNMSGTRDVCRTPRCQTCALNELACRCPLLNTSSYTSLTIL